MDSIKFLFNKFKPKIFDLNKSLKSLWVTGGIHILLGNYLIKFITFFGSIFLVRVLTKSSYGALGYIENIYGYFYLFAGLGASNSILRFVAKSNSIIDEKAYYLNAVKTGTYYNTVLMFLFVLIALIYPHNEEFINTRWLLVVLVIVIPFQFLNESNLFLLRAKFLNKSFVAFTVTYSILLVLVRFFGAKYFNLIGVVVGKVFITILFSLAISFFVNKKIFLFVPSTRLLNKQKKEVKKYSLQYMLTNGLWMLFMLNDVFLLGILGGSPNEIANYKVAYVIPANLLIISSSIGIYIAPYFIRNENDKKWIKAKYIKLHIFILFIYGALFIFIFIFSENLLIFLYGKQYSDAVMLMRLLLIAATINAAGRFTTANLLAAMGKIKQNMIISFIGVVFQILINIYMIDMYGAIGASITNIIVYFVMSIFVNGYFIREYCLSK